jgi:hypothetical protein
MPFLPALAAIIGIAGTGASIGMGINSSIDNSNFQNQQLAAQQAAAKNQSTVTPPTPAGPSQGSLQQVIGQTANDLVSNTSGLANPDYYGTLAPIFSGQAGQTNTPSALSQVMKNLFGGSNSTTNQSFTPAGTTPGPETGQINLSDFVYQLGGSGV